MTKILRLWEPFSKDLCRVLWGSGGGIFGAEASRTQRQILKTKQKTEQHVIAKFDTQLKQARQNTTQIRTTPPVRNVRHQSKKTKQETLMDGETKHTTEHVVRNHGRRRSSSSFRTSLEHRLEQKQNKKQNAPQNQQNNV